MRLRNDLRLWRGELLLAVLYCLHRISFLPAIRQLYHSLMLHLVERTRLFDEQYYLENNPDIAESPMGALFHYVVYGDREGRSPMLLFDAASYRKSVSGWTKHVNALLHFSCVGRFRRINPGPWFDVDYYLNNNKDVARAGVDPLIHYLEWGGIEGRSPCPHFDASYYLRKNPDVYEARVNPLLHYLLHGKVEGRRAAPQFFNGYAEVSEEDIPVPLYPCEEEWKALKPRGRSKKAEINVVVPVFKGKAETLRCIYSVLAAKCRTPFELVVINDASPDLELVGKLTELASSGMFTLTENSSNKGFVVTANRGMTFHEDRDVVLLNSDTEVYDGWLDRLKNAANTNQRVGTVTPLSNNATICSYPCFSHDNPYPLELEYSELDALISEENSGMTVETPTGVGFCMLIKRSCINDIGLFDEETYGKGYGEENDFCQRAIRQGWKNVIAVDVFVRHWGSVSFQGEKAGLSSRALKQVAIRYPRYQQDVAEFIRMEPLSEAYQRIDWARLLRLKREKNVLMISHARGGGTEKRLQEDMERYARNGYGVFVIRPVAGSPEQAAISHPAAKWIPNITPLQWNDYHTLGRALESLQITDIVSHSFVDFDKQAPATVGRLVETMGVNWVMNLHDYEVICPRINLVDRDGFYCREPGELACNRCLRMHGSSFDELDIRSWRALHEKAMLAANKIVVPDPDVKTRLYNYYPGVDVEVAPHEKVSSDSITTRRIMLEHDEKLRVVVIGAINKMKGFDVLRRCSRNARTDSLPIKFALLGYSLNDGLLEDAGVEVTGKYCEEEAGEKLKQLQPHVVWLPSLVPETYSYTLSIALNAGVPVVTFDIGAISRRLSECSGQSYILPLELAKDEAEIINVLMSIRSSAMVQLDSVGELVELFSIASVGVE